MNESGEENKKENKKSEGKIHNFGLLFLFLFFCFGEAENYMKNSSRETMREVQDNPQDTCKAFLTLARLHKLHNKLFQVRLKLFKNVSRAIDCAARLLAYPNNDTCTSHNCSQQEHKSTILTSAQIACSFRDKLKRVNCHAKSI